MTKSEIEKYIFLSFPYIDKTALSRLISDYGHPRSRLNVDLVKSFADNPGFMAAYAQLVLNALETRPFREAVENGLLDFATGTTTITTTGTSAVMTTGEQSRPGLFEWFNWGSNTLLTGFSQLNTFRWGGRQAEAQALSARAQSETARARIFQYAIIGVVVIVAVIAGIIAFKR